ncbi:hypothetical protein ACOTEY_29145 [Achromobacter xylosoxidans]
MNIDDVEDKTRRNLMAYCTAIIASTLLDVSISQNVLGITVKSDAAPWLVSVCANAVLLYLLVRFMLSPKVAEARSQWFMDHRQKIGARQLEYVKKELRAAIFYKLAPKGLKITGNHLPVTHRVIVEDPPPVIEWFDEGRGIFLGHWAQSVSNTAVGADYKNPLHGPVYFQLTRGRQRIYSWMLIQARYRLDWPSLELGFPLLMAFAAAGCILWKLQQAYPCAGPVGKYLTCQ